jgi:hypothetical protein
MIKKIMTKNEKIINNKMLADYMGWTQKGISEYITPFYHNYMSIGAGMQETAVFHVESMKFEKSFDWLMLVFDKINAQLSEPHLMWDKIRIYPDAVYLHARRYSSTHIVGVGVNRHKDIKECLYRCVIEYVEWFNNKKK